MMLLKDITLVWLQRIFLSKKASTTMKFCPCCKDYFCYTDSLSLFTQLGLKVHQMDVKSAFLHGDPTREIYEGRQSCLLIEKILIWFEIGPQGLVLEE